MMRTPIPAPPYQGRCLCGAVHYTISTRPKAVNACHCTDCKKLSGAHYIVMMVTDRPSLSHAGELTRYRKRADSGREIDIVRCAKCGVRLWHEPLASPELVFVTAGTLDDTSWAVPASHVWTKSASPGVTFHDDAWLCEAQPETRQLLMDAFARLYGPG